MEHTQAPQTPPPATAKPPLKARFKAKLEEYGPLLLYVYLSMSVLVFSGAVLALKLGLEIGGTAGTAGTLLGAWGFLKLTQPVRVPAALALTPLVARLLRRAPRSSAQP